MINVECRFERIKQKSWILSPKTVCLIKRQLNICFAAYSGLVDRKIIRNLSILKQRHRWNNLRQIWVMFTEDNESVVKFKCLKVLDPAMSFIVRFLPLCDSTKPMNMSWSKRGSLNAGNDDHSFNIKKINHKRMNYRVKITNWIMSTKKKFFQLIQSRETLCSGALNNFWDCVSK